MNSVNTIVCQVPAWRRLFTLLLGTALALNLAACTGESDSTLRIATDGAQPQLGLTAPSIIDTRRIDPQSLMPIVLVNGQPIAMVRGATEWTGNAPIEEGRAADVSITWVEQRNGLANLSLAAYTTRISAVNNNSEVMVLANEYRTDQFDDDSDSISNLSERLESSDPDDSRDPGINRPMAIVRAIDPADAPPIDGSFEQIWADSGQFLDRDRNNLAIDNLMIDINGAIAADENNFQWAAMHDGEYLYLFVFGENVDRQTPFGDSTMVWHDDTVDIFWNADNSRQNIYDGVDDYHLLVPLLKRGPDLEANNSDDVDARFMVGTNSAEFPVSGIDFATCLCPTDRNVWEIRINLAEAQIPVNQPIGFEIQMNDDNNGGLRDAKYGWFHPARQPGDTEAMSDRTWSNPSFMGRVRLEPLQP